MKTNFTHWIVYITAGLSTLASLNPALVAAIVGPTIGVYAVPVIGLASALVAFLHSVVPGSTTTTSTTTTTVPPAAPPTSSSTTTTTTKQGGFISGRGLAILLSASVMILAGCAAISKFVGSPDGTVALTAAADVAVATAESKGIAAAKINAIAKAALAADSSTTATLATISAAANAAIEKSGMPALDIVAVQVIEESLTAAVQAKLGANPSVASAQATVADVLKAVIAASGG